jgi:hypothetical protein
MTQSAFGDALTKADLKRQFPNSWQVFVDAYAQLERDTHRTMCQHVLEIPNLGMCAVLGMCAAHPAAGLLCYPCALAHVGRHSWELDHKCDECGAVVDTLSAFSMWASVPGLPIQTLDGRSGIIIGEILVDGIGLCTSCRAAS